MQIATAVNHTCARMSDGTLRCWGDGMGGELGDGSKAEKHSPVVVKGLDHAVDIAVGLAQSCARTEDGKLWCWGSTSFMEMDNRDDADTPRMLAAFAGADKLWLSHEGDGCARWSTKHLTKCWGSGAGYLATGHKSQYGTEPAQVQRVLETATDYSIAERLGCAVMKDKTAMCWGMNDRGQIGDDTRETRLDPVAVKGLKNVAQVAVSRESVCALLENGTVQCWGANDFGQLGDGTTEDHQVPKPANVKDVRQLVAASVHVCALHTNGKVTCWGNNRQGTLGDGHDFEHRGPKNPKLDDEDASGPVAAQIDHVTQLAVADFHTCALRDDGSVWCWGAGQRGSLGDGFASDRRNPTMVKWEVAPVVSKGLPAGVHVKSVAVGDLHSCVLLSDTTVRCWGRNDGGMVDGTGPTAGSQAKVSEYVTPVAVAGVSNVVGLSLRIFGSAAQLADGSVVMWGRDKGLEKLPIQPVSSFVFGGMMSCALRGDVASCTTDDKPATVSGAIAITTNHAFACALLKDKTVSCFGYNGRGQLGDGTFTERNTFAPVKGVKDVSQIVVGSDHACALVAGKVKCWGDGQVVGSNKEGPQEHPLDVPGLTDVVELTAGMTSVCARKKSGKVACWGFYGLQSFSASRDKWYSAKPRDVPWLDGATQLALGMNHSCALFPGDKVACWGENDAGQLGDGTMDARDVATPVKW